jgi:parallel beta-helix repeat protein
MKKQKIIISLIAILLSLQLAAQQNVAINTTGAAPDASAILDVSSTNKGLLVPRVALTQTSLATPITTPATSLLVYNTATVNDVTPGYYYWDGTQWKSISSGGAGTQDDDWLPLGAANTALIYHEGAVNTQTLNNIAIVGPNAFATIQDAINSLPANGGKVLVTAGTWTITTQISFPNDNITVEGVGESSIIESSGNHSIFYLNSRDNIQINNLSIRYSSYISGNTSRNAIYLYRSANAKILNCHIENAYRAVYLSGSSTKYTENNSIHNNYIQNSYYGITTGAGITPTNYYVRKNMVHNNKIINNERYGICFAGSSYSNNISDNEIDNAVQGIVMFHSDSNIVSNNRILNVGRSISPGVGIGVQGASNNFITDNYISGVIGTVSNASAIRVIQQNGVWCYHTSITGNQIHLDGTMTGIRVTAPIGAVISTSKTQVRVMLIQPL